MWELLLLLALLLTAAVGVLLLLLEQELVEVHRVDSAVAVGAALTGVAGRLLLLLLEWWHSTASHERC